jgi:hypothetical protein
MNISRRIESARTNGARSKGPVTPEGKLASSRSNLTHGLLASTVALDGESKDGFEMLHASFLGQFRPSTPAESALVETMATARWRQMRIWALQKVAVDLEMARLAEAAAEDQAPADPNPQPEGMLAAVRATIAMRSLSDDSRYMELLHRYETAYERQFLRALSTIQRDRREHPAPTTSKLPASYASPASVSATFFAPTPPAKKFDQKSDFSNEPVFQNETK